MTRRWPAMLRPVRLDSPTAGSMARRGALGTIGVGAQGAVRFITSFLVGRIGGPAVLGVVQSAISTALLLSLLWPTTTGGTASKYVARARGKGDSVEAAAVAAHLAKRTLQAALLLAVISLPIWVAIDHGSLAQAASVAALVLGYSGYSFTRGLAFGAGQIPRATSWDVLAGTLGLTAMLAALAAGVRGTLLLLPLAGAYGLYAAAGWPWHAHSKPARALRRELDGFVALGVLGTLASTGFLQLSMIVVRVMDGTAHAGQYAAALALATPSSLLAGSLSLVLFPSMAEAWGRGDHEGFRRQTDQATRLLVVVMVPLLGALALCSRLIVSLVWGDRFVESADLLPVLLLAVLATTLGVASVNALTTSSQQGMLVSSAASVTGLVVGVLAWLVLAPSHGMLGVAIGYLCGTVVIAAVPVAVVWRRDSHHWSGLGVRLGVGILLAVTLVVIERTNNTSFLLDPLFAFGFWCGWLAIVPRDTRGALALIHRPGRGRRPHEPSPPPRSAG